MRPNRSEQKQEARTAGSIQHKQPTLASLLLLVTRNAIQRPNYETWDGNCSNTLRRLDVGCSRPNSQRSARCHLSETDLDASNAWHISARGNVLSRVAGSESAGPEAGTLSKYSQHFRLFRHFSS